MKFLRAARGLLGMLLVLAFAAPAYPSSLTLTGVGKPGTSIPTMLTYRYAGFTGQTPNATWTTNATKASQLGRAPDAIMSDSDQCALWWDNWAFTGSEVNGTSTYALDKVSVEIPTAPTPVVAVTFSAGRTKTFTAGQAQVFSDTFSASAFGLTYIPAGTRYWVKWVAHTTGAVTDVTRDRGLMNGTGGGAVVTGSISGYYQSPGDSTDTNQVDTAGAWNIGSITTGAGAVAANVHMPSGIVCRTTSTANPIIATVDSLGDGYLAFSFDFTSGTGGMIRAAAWAAQKPLFIHGKFGTKPSQYSTKTNSIIQAQYSSSRLFTSAIQETGTNEFDGANTIGGIETTYTNLQAILADASHGGARPVYVWNTVIPNQTATDGATSYANQTKYSGGTDYFEAFNTWETTKGPSGDGTWAGIFTWAGMYNSGQANKVTVPGITWTLGSSVASGATTLRLNGSTAPVVGQGIWVAGTGSEGLTVGTVSVVTPGSVWDVGLYGTTNTALNINGGTVNAHSSGVSIGASYQPMDLSHFTQQGHASMAASYAGSAPFN